MLKQVENGAIQGGTSTERVIALSGSSNNIMYTVPGGKRFEGYFSGSSGNSALIVNGGYLYCPVNSTGSAAPALPITLLAGSVVAASSGSTSLWGIERDV
ncbi:hypothetical protein [Roseibium sp. MB-4]